METKTFPEVSGKNLKRKKLTFPTDFPAEHTVVLMAFYRHQQLDIDTWLPFVSQMESDYEDLAYVELPVIYRMGPLGQWMLNEGMRAGIPNQKARERTITLYLNKSNFLGQMGIDSQDQIQILLVDRQGKIYFQETGRFSAEKGEALVEILQREQLQKETL
jgi:hypothetical protein